MSMVNSEMTGASAGMVSAGGLSVGENKQEIASVAGTGDVGATQTQTQQEGGVNVGELQKVWVTDAQSDVSSLGPQTAISSAVRSSISEVAEMRKIKKKNQTTYLCADCLEETSLGPNDPVRCTSCGNRILYKKRGNAPVQYHAR
eukprot:TRINITY_DN46813_c0_g1_i1.p1 TRINITY_DN46813_c0_g1~~TRINITY_DN46813_c0_g1_i1.p1  ORF type:complete len:161 (+),score=21.24 TRINITY_DN46813_c0_g1_i1:49-483(+)